MKPMINMIAVLSAGTRVIGRDNGLPWRSSDIPGDLKRFKQLTTGHPVIMGRKTWDSLPEKQRPLPDRINFVISHQHLQLPGALMAHSFPEALQLAMQIPDVNEVFIGGGGQIYAQALPHADRLYLTLVEEDVPGDTHFPEYEERFPQVLERVWHEHNGLHYRFETRVK